MKSPIFSDRSADEVKYVYSTYDFLTDMPFKAARAAWILSPLVQWCHIGTAGPMTPLYKDKQD
jgi:hypothetical protein